MSLLNIIVGDDVAWVAFDTDGISLRENRHYPWSKAVPIVHANVLLACRGERNFLTHTFFQGFLRDGPTNFDSFAGIFEDMLRAAAESYAQQAAQAGVDAASIGLEIVMVGWSESQNRPVCLAASRSPNTLAFEIKETRCRIAPGVPCSDLSSIAAVADLARKQVFAMRSSQPNEPIGGNLMLAEITRLGMSFKTICQLS